MKRESQSEAMCHQNCHRHCSRRLTKPFTPSETPGAAATRLPPHAGEIGAAAAAAPLRHNARQNARRCCHLTPGTSALQTPLRRCVSTRRNARRCSRACGAAISPRGHRRCSRCCAASSPRPAKRRLSCSRACAATTSRPGTSALQPLLCRFVSTPSETPGAAAARASPSPMPDAAAARAPSPPHARGHRRFSRCYADSSLRPAKRPALQPRASSPPTCTK